MSERRIMSLGRSSMVISLPKNWLQLTELNKGDVVSYAIQRDRSLVIYPRAHNKVEKKEITLHVAQNEDEDLTTLRIIGCYLNGYTGITLVSDSIFTVPQRKSIRNTAGMLYMRIMESDAKGIYMQELIDEAKASLEQGIQRMHLISQTMCEDAFAALRDNNVELAKSVFSMHEDVSHFTFFILRLLREAVQNPALANKLRIDPLDCMDYEMLVYSMEHAADYAADVARHMIMLHGEKEQIPEEVCGIIQTAGILAVESYAKAVNTFFSKDIFIAIKILKTQQRVNALDQEIAAKSFTGKQKSPQLVCGICSIRDNIKRIADSAADISGLVMNRAFKA